MAAEKYKNISHLLIFFAEVTSYFKRFLLYRDERRQQQGIEYHNLISAPKLFFKNLASVVSYLSSDDLRYSKLNENFKTKLQASI